MGQLPKKRDVQAEDGAQHGKGELRRALAALTPLPPELDAERLLDVTQTTALLNVAADTLETWRRNGKGPPFLRIHKRTIRYRLRDVLEWRDALLVGKRP